MRRHLGLKRSLLLAPALLLAACAGTRNRGLESVHQPVVSRADYALDLAATPTGLAAGETRRLADWLGAMRVGYGDRVAVDDPAGIAGARAAVAKAAAAHGVLLALEPPAPGGAPVAPGTVRVVVSRLTASVPGCPDWSRDASVDWNQNTSSNHGCAINSNLAAMVADPADLVRGQHGDGIADPEASFRAIDAYRKAAPSGGGGQSVKAAGVGGK